MNRPRDARGAYSDTRVDTTGSSPPRPSPVTTRAASSSSNDGAAAESRLPIEKMMSVIWKTFRRP